MGLKYASEAGVCFGSLEKEDRVSFSSQGDHLSVGISSVKYNHHPFLIFLDNKESSLLSMITKNLVVRSLDLP